MTAAVHPDFPTLAESWDLALAADGYATNSRLAYARALASLARWAAATRPGTGPAELTRDDVRSWLVHTRATTSSGTARAYFAGVRHFCRWLLAEGESAHDPTAGVKTPAPNEVSTPVLATDDVRALLATCTGTDFAARRDRAILLVFVDCGLRLAEVAGLTVDDVDLRDRALIVRGKGSNRSGPRLRAAALGTKTAQALDRYLRERRRHRFADRPALWLGARNQPTLGPDGVERMLQRRAELAGVKGLHPHVFRHTWASQFRAAGGSEGDLMVQGGWRNRAMLDRYGRAAAAERAQEAARRLSLADRL